MVGTSALERSKILALFSTAPRLLGLEAAPLQLSQCVLDSALIAR